MTLLIWLAALGIGIILLRKFVRSIALPESFFKKKDEDDNEPDNEPVELNKYGYPERNNRA